MRILSRLFLSSSHFFTAKEDGKCFFGGNEEREREKNTNIIQFFCACKNDRVLHRCRGPVHESPRMMTRRGSSHTGQGGQVELTDVISRCQRRDDGGGGGSAWGREPNLAFLEGYGLIYSPYANLPSYRGSVTLN